MSYPVKFLSLQKTELEYEIAIRGDSPATTVQEMRKQIAKLGPLFPSEDVLDSPFEADDDLEGVSETLEKIKSNLGSSLDRNTLLRTQNLLNHLYHRINRIIIDDISSKPVYDSCVSQFKKYLDIVKSSKHREIDPLSSNMDSSNPSSSALPVNVSVSCDRGLSSDLGKIKYDGKTCVRAFIQRINEFCAARDIAESKVLSYATEIFTGDALHWFRSVRDRVSTWSEVIDLLKRDFSQSDYDYRLLSEIRSRTQGESENITIYLSIMSGLFSRLTKTLSEEDKLEIILHNIRPCYASTLASANEISTLDSLLSLCRNYENIQARLANFREPSSATSSTLAPEFAYNDNKHKFGNKTNSYKQNYSNQFSKFNNKNNNTNYNANRNINKDNSNNNYPNKTCQNQNYIHAIETGKPRFCPRCRVNTHNLRQCTENKDKIYCFRCGRKDVKTPDCPDCSKVKTSVSKN